MLRFRYSAAFAWRIASCSAATRALAGRGESGDVFLAPTELRTRTKVDHGAHISLQVPWAALRSRAGERDGVPTAGLRFTAMTPVSAAAKRVFARTAEFNGVTPGRTLSQR